ncbi:hypothetical protein EJB05_09088, partial [Eragrostis curvula]
MSHHKSKMPSSTGMGLGPLLELQQDKQLADLVKNWDFSIGRSFQEEVAKKYRSSVHHPSSSPHDSFLLLAIFQRFTFRLTEDSVIMALHSCLGGTPAGFHVTYLQDRHFRFSVASKDVGLAVCALKRIISKQFDVYFHLWRDGGDKWERERKRWEEEEANSWTLVSREERQMSIEREVQNAYQNAVPMNRQQTQLMIQETLQQVAQLSQNIQFQNITNNALLLLAANSLRNIISNFSRVNTGSNGNTYTVTIPAHLFDSQPPIHLSNSSRIEMLTEPASTILALPAPPAPNNGNDNSSSNLAFIFAAKPVIKKQYARKRLKVSTKPPSNMDESPNRMTYEPPLHDITGDKLLNPVNTSLSPIVGLRKRNK